MNTVVKVKGMSCNHCAMAVKKALGGLAGISGVEVDLGKGEVSMEHQGPIEMGVVRSEIEKAGYEVSS